MATGKDIVDEARRWVGTPFRHQGRVLGRGVDCVGLVSGVARQLELLPPGMLVKLEAQYAGYGREPSKGILDGVVKFTTDSADGGYQDGDILLMKFLREPQHLAIYCAERNTIIHAYSLVNKCVEHTLDMKWRRRIVSAHRFRGLENER